MKQLSLKSSNYRYLEQSFQQWLNTLGYANRTTEGSPIQLREYFYHLETQNIHHINHIQPNHTKTFFNHLKTRTNQRTGGGLSNNTFNTYISTLKLFSSYLYQTSRYQLEITTRRLPTQDTAINILTPQEIQDLYETTYLAHTRLNNQALGQRDRAIIAILYGCGLRKAEAANLDINDIDLVKRLVFVKKGKGNKQRHVPIATRNYEDIRTYLEEGRYWFLQDNQSSRHVKKGLLKQGTDAKAFFLNHKGRRMNCFGYRLKVLRAYAGITTPFSTHTLRHSIATHLLQSGMPLEEIAKFLGHSTLASTQIYTHIISYVKKHKNEAASIL